MELLFSQAEADSYLASLNLQDTTVVRVLASIQLLSANLFNEIMYFLINGQVTIATLNSMNVNNVTIQGLVDSLSSAPVTVVETKIFYKNLLEALPGYTPFFTTFKSNTVSYLARQMLSSTTYSNSIVVDPIGIVPNSFTSVQAAKLKYNTLKATQGINATIAAITSSGGNIDFSFCEVPATSDLTNYTLTFNAKDNLGSVYVNGVLQAGTYTISDNTLTFFAANMSTDLVGIVYNTTDTSNSYDTTDITTQVNAEVNAYAFIYDTLNVIPLGLDYKLTYSGFALKDITSNISYMNLIENINWLAGEMTNDFSHDSLQIGMYTVLRLLNTYKWSDLATTTSFPDFLASLIRIYFVRVTVLQWYGTSYFAGNFVAAEQDNFNRIATLFSTIKDDLTAFSTYIKENIYV